MEFKAHRFIICAHSKWFDRACSGGFAEASTQKAELKEDMLQAVEKMIEFFYTCDYNDSVAFCDAGTPADQTGAAAAEQESNEQCITNRMELNAWVYATAEKYGALVLKALALEKFKASTTDLKQDWSVGLEAARAVYNEVPFGDDNAVRDLLLSEVLMSEEAVHNAVRSTLPILVKDVPDFAVALIDSLMDHSTEKGFTCPACAAKGTIDKVRSTASVYTASACCHRGSGNWTKLTTPQ